MGILIMTPKKIIIKENFMPKYARVLIELSLEGLFPDM